MPCRKVPLPEGGFMIVCSRGQKPKLCTYCSNPSEVLCDGPGINPEKTCDKPMCRKCATHVPGKDLDYCHSHRHLKEEQPTLGI